MFGLYHHICCRSSFRVMRPFYKARTSASGVEDKNLMFNLFSFYNARFLVYGIYNVEQYERYLFYFQMDSSSRDDHIGCHRV
jgi:hypothetical protein